jgi:hypothetical protein
LVDNGRVRKLLGFALVLAATSPAPAWATPEGDERAKVLFAAGKDHYDHGQYEQAASEFESAYALSLKPELRYNLYLTYERMGKFDVALTHLDAYLAEGQPSPEERAQLETRREALRQRADAAAAIQPRAPRTGFMARLALGVGYANADTDDYRIYGGTGDLVLAVGWRLVDQLALHVSLWGGSMVGATIQGKGAFSNLITRDAETTYAVGALGLGATVYLPAEFYVSGSIGAGSVSAERGGTKTESKAGVAVLVSGGKDWSLSRDWRLGVAASISFLSIPEEIMGPLGATTKVQASVVLLSVLGSIAFD